MSDEIPWSPQDHEITDEVRKCMKYLVEQQINLKKTLDQLEHIADELAYWGEELKKATAMRRVQP